MGNDWNKWLQERAYAFWEKDNRPDGRHEEHWRQAEEELKQFPPQTSEPVEPVPSEKSKTEDVG